MNKNGLRRIKNVYFIGIKGTGMSALAEILKKRGFNVSGSDTQEKFYTEAVLKRSGIRFREGFSAANVPPEAGLVVYSTAYSEKNNVEFAEARRRELLMLSYPEMLGMIFNESLGMAVCGTHGKTTTSAILAELFRAAGVDPSAVVGSRVLQWKGSSLAGKGEYFVIEADEYQNKLQHYDPFGVILTSVDWDHPDFFPTFSEYKESFKSFVRKIPPHGFLVVWGDSTDTLEVAGEARCQVIRYGFGGENDIVILKSAPQHFTLRDREEDLGEFEVKLIGDHNILNSAAAVAVCSKLNLDLEKVRRALKNFRGTQRRFELIGETGGALLIDDYAHHPEEIRATLKGAREQYPNRRIFVVFHPHTFTRTKSLLQEFSQSFDDADRVIVIDIYGSAREKQGGVSSAELVGLINRYSPEKAEHIPSIPEAVEHLQKHSRSGDVIISMGAGNVWEVTHQLKKRK